MAASTPVSGSKYTVVITATAAGNSNYNSGSKDITMTVTVGKATNTVNITCASLTYTGSAQTLVSSASASSGSIYYKVGTQLTSSNYNTTGSTTKPTGTNAGSYTIYYYVPSSGNYNAANGNKSCSIGKKSVAVSWGSTTSFTYNGSAQAPTASVATGVSGETMSVTRTTGTNVGSYTSTASCSSVSGGQATCNNYTLTSTTKAFTITKATNNVNITCASLTYTGSAQTLVSSASASSGSIYYKVGTQLTSSNYNTTGSTTKPTGTNAGSYTIYYYVPASDNYNAASGNKSCSIAKAANPIAVTASQGGTISFSTSAQTKEITAATGAQGTVTYSIQSQKNNGGTSVSYFSISGTTLTIAANTPPNNELAYTIVIRATAAGNSNYNSGYKDITMTLWILRATNPITVTASQSWSTTFSTSAQTKSVTAATGAQGTVTYSIKSQKNTSGTAVSYFSISGTTLTMAASTPVSGSKYTVVITATAAGNDNYNSGSKDITMTVTVGKIPNTVNITCASLTYTGGAQTLISSASATSGTIYYGFETALTSSNYNTTGSTTKPTAVNAGSYTIYYYVPASTNYNAASGSKTCSIAKAAGSCEVSIGGSVYWGSSLTATVTANSNGSKSYKWYSNSSSTTSGGSAISGATNSSYTIGAGLGGKYIYVNVSLDEGTNWTAATCSGVTTSTVNAAPRATLSMTSNSSTTQQTATLTCNDDTGISTFYVGTSSTSSGWSYSGDTSLSTTVTVGIVSGSNVMASYGTLYGYCYDADGNKSNVASKGFSTNTVFHGYEGYGNNNFSYNGKTYGVVGGTGWLLPVGSYSVSTFTSPMSGYTYKGYSTGSGATSTLNTSSYVSVGSQNGFIYFFYDKSTSTASYSLLRRAPSYTITYHLGNGTSKEGTSVIGTSSCSGTCTLDTWNDLGAVFPGSANDGWQFYGWTTSKDGIIREYMDGSEITLTEDIDLYAIGSKDHYFYSGYEPSSYTDRVTQYWNPYSTADDYLTSITIPRAVSLDASEVGITNYNNNWSVLGYVAGSSTSFTPTVSELENVIPKYNENAYKRAIYYRIIDTTYNDEFWESDIQYYNSGISSNGNISDINITLPSSSTVKNWIIDYTYDYANGSSLSDSFEVQGSDITIDQSYIEVIDSSPRFSIIEAS